VGQHHIQQREQRKKKRRSDLKGITSTQRGPSSRSRNAGLGYPGGDIDKNLYEVEGQRKGEERDDEPMKCGGRSE
jgi:hypothetical protein